MSDTDLSPENNLRWHFPTPIFAYVWQDCDAVNQALRTLILETEAKGNPKFGHIEGGWASTKDFFSWDAECVRALEAHIQRMLSAVVSWMAQKPLERVVHYDLQCWANVLRDGGYHALHSHPNSFWSGVYYAGVGTRTGETRRNGCIEFMDPRSATGAILMQGTALPQECLMSPEPGMTIIFPGWLKHMVHPFYGEGERISIAFNLDREN
jgi:uncharacterized protein (TIGR02466 family)